MTYPPELTIAYLIHGDIPLLDQVIPTTLEALCVGTSRRYDLLLVIDGAESAPTTDIMSRAHDVWGFDEIRLRWRTRHRASGDKTNNIHTHLVGGKSRYLITVEGDVVAFRSEPYVDVLDQIVRMFEARPDLAVAQRIDDHDCWQWQLEDVGQPLAPGIRSVNRVASHFIIYDTERMRARIAEVGGLPGDEFYDDGTRWFNYEDWLSQTFAQPDGPGIGYLDDLPLCVYHCDRKISPGSAHYRRDLPTRLAVFEERREQVKAANHA